LITPENHRHRFLFPFLIRFHQLFITLFHRIHGSLSSTSLNVLSRSKVTKKDSCFNLLIDKRL